MSPLSGVGMPVPSAQRGSVFRRGDGWAVRYYDEAGARRRQGGFATKSDAHRWLDSKVEEVAALRRGDPLLVPVART